MLEVPPHVRTFFLGLDTFSSNDNTRHILNDIHIQYSGSDAKTDMHISS